jgi:hypothetical protein
MREASVPQSEPEQVAPRIFRCRNGCIHLQWKDSGIINLTCAQLVALRRQLICACERMIRQDDTCAARYIFQVECNEGILLAIRGTEVLVLLSRIGAFLTECHHCEREAPQRYLM